MTRSTEEKIELNQVVILAGGRGERLRPLTDNIPKPMAPVNGVPFLDYLIKTVLDVGIKRILILAGYKSEIIVNKYKSTISGMEIEYSIGTAEDDTGRRLLDAYDLLDEHFLLLYGDNYWPIELDKMLDLYNTKNAEVMTTVFSNKNGTGEYGDENNIEVSDDSFVKRYDKQRRSSGLNGVDIGYFIVAKKALDPNISENISFEKDILPEQISKGQLVAHVTDTQYYYITNFKSIRNFELVVIDKGFEPVSNYLLQEAVENGILQ